MRRRTGAIGIFLLLVAANVSPAAEWFVATNGSDTADGASWAAAKLTIQAGVDAAASNDTVWVSNGVYATGGRIAYGALTNRVVVDKPITVRSLNGPASTRIKGAWDPNGYQGIGDGAVRCAYIASNAVLSGFTLTNGATRSSGDPVRERSGGGAWCEPSGVLTNCVLTRNFAATNGGGSFQGTLYNCTLSGNDSWILGGGSSSGTLFNCTLDRNTALQGGASYNDILYNCNLISNAVEWRGGGAYRSTLSNCTLTGNSAGTAGGGTAESTLENCILTGNATSTDGGGAYASMLNDCTLTGNAASNNGGGTYSCELNKCTLNENSALGCGGGGACGTMRSCFLTGNSAFFGGGGYYGIFGGALSNCTVVGNAASYGGGVLEGTLNNCIVYYNLAPTDPNFQKSMIVYSCTTPLPTGTGNITNEPRLASASHLAADSPCIRNGSSTYALGTDIDGETWLNPPSMGCDEVVAGAITGALSVGAWVANTNVQTGFPLQFQALIFGRTSSSVWRWGDGAATSNQPYAIHSFPSNGIYPVCLVAYNEAFPLGVAATVTVQAAAQMVHYVSLSNASPSEPYASWATAATSIQDAIDVASQIGALVLVSNGVYASGGRVVHGAMTNRVVIDRPIAVKSVNGPDTTLIKGRWHPGTTNGNSAVRCAYVGANAVLSGFTLTNGATRSTGEPWRENSGGGVWSEPLGALSNCVITGNAALYGGGAYGGVYYRCTFSANRATDNGGGMRNGLLNWCNLSSNWSSIGGGSSGGILNHCIISGNIGTNSGGGAMGGDLNNCIMYENRASYGGGSRNGSLNNCTLAGNRAFISGGGSYYGTLNNCIVFANISPFQPNYDNSTFTNCCTRPDPGGTGNITNDPQFVNSGGGNYRLGFASPCKDAGDNAAVPGGTDLDGHPRIVNGTVDMGAYELQDGGTLFGNWAAGITNGLTNATDCAAGDGRPNLLRYAAGCPDPMVPDDLTDVDVGNAGAPKLMFNRNTDASDISLIVESADAISNGAAWRGVATNVGGSWLGATNVEESGTGNPVECTVTDPVALQSNRFLRLRVSRP